MVRTILAAESSTSWCVSTSNRKVSFYLRRCQEIGNAFFPCWTQVNALKRGSNLFGSVKVLM
jgi:hypothetical protein